MKVYAQIKKGKYIDSLETLFSSSVLNEQPGVDVGYVGMATASFKDILAEIGLMTEEIDGCGDNDYVIVARAESEEAFRQAAAAVTEDAAAQQGGAEQSNGESFSSVRTAVQAHPEANMCSIAVPGEYALSEVKKALNVGLHCVVFSNNVPLEDEREMKELAREKGLLCMGPDCGVANINGAALVLASIKCPRSIWNLRCFRYGYPACCCDFACGRDRREPDHRHRGQRFEKPRGWDHDADGY